MKDLIKNNWINGLGITFLFTAFLYFLKIAADAGWLPPEVRATSGLTLGVSGLFVGYTLFKKGTTYLAETIAGLGNAIIYATLAYVSFTESIAWSNNALLISITTICIATSYIAIKSDMRILYLLSTVGSLTTPMILKANDTQDMMLFIYLLIINIGALYVSFLKKWNELKIVSFVSSLAIYTTYYVIFKPEAWEKPFFYITSFFLVYMVGIVLSSWNQKSNEIGINQYLGLLNAINFVFWSNFIFSEFQIPHTIPMLLVGIIFIGTGALMFYLKERKLGITNGAYLAIGIIVIAIACSDTALILSNGTNYVLNSAIWLILIFIAFFFGKKCQNRAIQFGSYIALFFLTIYWYSVAWSVNWITIFSIKFIPFFNLGAFIWLGIAFLGFYFSKNEVKHKDTLVIKTKISSTLLAILSHIVVGGLLTVQISNLWEAYEILIFKKELAVSISWIIYALTIYTWSNFSKNKVFQILGAIVLISTSIKVFVSDLSGSATFQKVIFLTIIGGLTLLIGKISSKNRIKT